MKILLVADSDTKYGASHSMCQMAVALKRYKHVDVTVLLPRYSKLLVDEMKNWGIEVYYVNYTPYYQNYPNKLWKFPIKYIIRGCGYLYTRYFALHRLEQKIDIQSYDLIHSNSSREDFGAKIAEKYNLPLIWHIREFGDRDYKCYSYRLKYVEYMNQRADALLAVSEVVKQHWIAKGIKKEKIVRVYNGVKCSEKWNVTNSVGVEKDIKLVMTGSICETKGQRYAIEVVKKLYDKGISVKLDIVGDGTSVYVKRMKKMCIRYGLENNVSFLGYKDDVQSILPNYNIGLICSKDEAFGRVTAEYMMAGLSVLATDTGANAELIRNGTDGLLFSYGDINDMEQKLLTMIKYGKKMGGKKTHEYAISEFSDFVNAKHVYEVYDRVLSERKGLEG